MLQFAEVLPVLELRAQLGVQFLDPFDQVQTGRGRGHGSFSGAPVDGFAANGLGDDELVLPYILDVVILIIFYRVEIHSHAFQELERGRADLLVQALLEDDILWEMGRDVLYKLVELGF